MEKINFQDYKDFEHSIVKIADIQQTTPAAWEVLLNDKETNKGLYITVNIGQVTDILLGLSNSAKHTMSPNIYQFINSLCITGKIKIDSIIIYYVDDYISKTVAKLKQNETMYFFELSTGDALSLASILQIPIYAVNKYLEEVEEDDDSIEYEDD